MTSTVTTAEVAWLMFLLAAGISLGASAGISAVLGGIIKDLMRKTETQQQELDKTRTEKDVFSRQLTNLAAFGKVEREPPPPPEPRVSITSHGDLTMGGGVQGRDYTGGGGGNA